MTTFKKPFVLCVLDGWGLEDASEYNSISRAQTPTYDRLLATHPWCALEASGPAVGLPEGQMGNSEVGHLTLGAGRVLLQDLERFNEAFESKDFEQQDAFKELVSKLQASGGNCHLMGLLSPGGIHSHMDHIIALAKSLNDKGIPVLLHAFLDGRDTAPQSAKEYITTLQAEISGTNIKIASITGRFYAMDRDQRWERIQTAYQAIVEAKSTHQFLDPLEAVDHFYASDITDEFIPACTAEEYPGAKDGDALVMVNFRADRARQILHALVDLEFTAFPRQYLPKWAAQTGLTTYSEALSPLLSTLYPKTGATETLGEILSKHGLHQLRIAETEKYAHVTFFFNGGVDKIFVNEDRILVPSPKVRTYDLEPKMSADKLTDHLVKAIDAGAHDFILINYANPDMVGHTGDLSASIQAIEVIDACLERVSNAIRQVNGTLLITADHGNAECMLNTQTLKPHTAHTTNQVPLILISDETSFKLQDGSIADVAPTILKCMNILKPTIMTGENLIK